MTHLDDLKNLDAWIEGWLQKMHRDISDEERGRIADDMCCEWYNSGMGRSIKDTIERGEGRDATEEEIGKIGITDAELEQLLPPLEFDEKVFEGMDVETSEGREE